MLKIQTQITDSEQDSSSLNVLNSIDTFNSLVNTFTVSQTHVKKQNIEAGVPINIPDLLAFFGVEPDNCAFIHIQIADSNQIGTINDGKFMMSIDGNLLGSFSQITLVNNDVLLGSISIDQTIVTRPSKLIIVVGEK